MAEAVQIDGKTESFSSALLNGGINRAMIHAPGLIGSPKAIMRVGARNVATEFGYSVAMLGSKSNKESQQFDTFACLRCETTVTFVPPPEGSKPDR